MAPPTVPGYPVSKPKTDKADELPAMMSDGKRVRPVWKPGDGDGDPSRHLIDRSMGLVRGHPTWKIYVDEVHIPIIRDSPTEPPHYVYLDDRSCCAIYEAQVYSKEELRQFFPFDFDHQGNIKGGRPNRGNPAYLDDSNTEYTKGPLRGKGKWYTFSGAPEVTNYRPVRPNRYSKVAQGLAREYGIEEDGDIEHDSSSSQLESLPAASIAPETFAPKASPVRKLQSRSPLLRTGKSMAPNTSYTQPSTQRSTFPVAPDRGSPVVSLPPKSVYGTPYGNTPPKARHGNVPASRNPSFSRINPAGGHAEIRSNSLCGELLQNGPRRYGRQQKVPDDDTEREEDYASSVASEDVPDFGGDGAQDDFASFSGPCGATGDQDKHAIIYSQHQQMCHEDWRDKFERLKSEYDSLELHLARVTEERANLRQVVLMFTTNKLIQHHDLTERITTLQHTCDLADDLKDRAQELKEAARKGIEPTAALCEGINTVLDGPGKFMYNKGMDEEWKAIHEEAEAVAQSERTQPSYPPHSRK